MDKLKATDPATKVPAAPAAKPVVAAMSRSPYLADDLDAAALAAAKARPAGLTSAQAQQVAVKKATCPFIGAAVASQGLTVRNSAASPLAAIDDVVALGNTGGGDLGKLLKLFASGNHAFMQGADGHLDAPVPAGLFSLDFPGSQGSHPGHSGILQGDPTQLDSGRLSAPDLQRLCDRAKDGYLKRSDVAKFIAENLANDPNSKVLDGNVAKRLFGDLHQFAGTTGPALLAKLRKKDHVAEERKLTEALTKTLGEDNLVGSAGEFGLLMAFLAHSPRSKKIGGEPAIAVADVQAMFQDHRFPDGWEQWPKTRHDWVVNTTALMVEAGKEFHNLK
ncbi:MAG: hypothetical protein JWM80_5503 [Cyanobacteria bacterium RYN_339]|nr:hypothetical protein [Cyanobacteria bacterium RYN_339]